MHAPLFGFSGLYGRAYGLTREERDALWRDDETAGMVDLTERNVPSQQAAAERESLSPTERGAVYRDSTQSTKQRAIDGAWLKLNATQQAELNKIARVYAPDNQRPASAKIPASYLLSKLADGTVPLSGPYFGWLSGIYTTQVGALRAVGAEWRKRQGLPPVGAPVVDVSEVVDAPASVSPVLVGAGILAAVIGGYFLFRGK